MPTPLNASAQTIVQLRSTNGDIESQVETLCATQARNEDVIAALEPLAEWGPDPEPEEDEEEES